MAKILDQSSINTLVENANSAKAKLNANYIKMKLEISPHDLSKKTELLAFIDEMLMLTAQDESERIFLSQLRYIKKML